MLTEDKIKLLLTYAQDNQERLALNARLLNIYDNNIVEEVQSAMAREFSGQTYDAAVTRISPINVCRRIVDKLSVLYAKGLKRLSANSADTTAATIDNIEVSSNINAMMASADELLNLHKYVLLQPYSTKDAKVKFRAIPADRFLVWSDDIADPTNPTAVILCHGQNADHKKIYKIFDEDQNVLVSEDGEILSPLEPNPGGTLPFVYLNKSKYQLMPKPDLELLKISILIPVLLTDLNYATKFQAFGLIYGINLDMGNLKIGPNFILDLKSDESGNSPEIGTLTPDAQVDKMLSSMASQLSLYLETRGLRPGSAGNMDLERAESGIAQIIQSVDITDDLSKRKKMFERAETDMWALVDTLTREFWELGPLYEVAPGDRVQVHFEELKPILTDSERIGNIIDKLEAGLITHRMAVSEANPGLNDSSVDAIVAETQEKRSFDANIENNEEDS